MKKLLFILGLLVSGLGFAQDETAKDTVQVDQPVEVPQIVVKVPYGKLTTFGDLAIKIIKVTDSRCPADVNCIWAGNVILDYEVYKDGKFLETKKLTLGGGNEDSTLFKSDLNWLKAYSVAPYPKASAKIDQKDYVIKMLWEQLTEDN
ncbi:hypothetical protein [Leeuwenhoekiella nanhaiensis]|uniref:TonB C-terminal domain-containing protein n=1 Tax=Leeuwenhoekiella nanhaiensis TaxID=1655491 RepID=A0A2G1VW95_9FLAO|nr:hypothetical protein [Leeuwenhoekiella nanhaiensis]PHQ30880.1 hypothetical protein CJ305_01230 [Leeuwenhoekiella nanhaiensis]